jgi:CRISPR-associated endonuclease/helicase Cas3
MENWLAHSGDIKCGVLPQAYAAHVTNVAHRAMENTDKLTPYYSGDLNFFRNTVKAAAVYHDLGKLDGANQKVLSAGRGRGLPLNHVDAGSAYLLANDFVESAFLVCGHHIGLASIPEEQSKEQLFLRDGTIVSHTETCLAQYISRHDMSGMANIALHALGSSDWTGLARRVAMSCLVDADHGDTAENYLKESPCVVPLSRWDERLRKLDEFVSELGKGSESQTERNRLRRRIYACCREGDTNAPIFACDSPVGTGKTTAIMAHLLKAAIEKNLRHIIVVLPYTNIIRQSVEIYRKALVLDGEDPSDVVAEHHHQADFDELRLRQIATLWRAPVIVTTAVQFFETIASSHPSKLRKLHELPGSGVFVDETQSAIPPHLWPQTWKWMKELSMRWGVHWVLASGSLPRFWELKHMIEAPEILPDLVDRSLRDEAIRLEQSRVVPTRHPYILDIEGLLNLSLSKAAPRLIIMNTVQSAAVIAHSLALRFYPKDYATGKKLPVDLAQSKVLHLSTSLAPTDREKVIEAIRRRFSAKGETDRDFTVVATSCVEAGVDFSFTTALRERAGTANLIQVGGRVRRHSEDFEPTLIDFRIEAPLINRHPAFELSGQILEKLFAAGRIGRDSPADLVTEALRQELISDTALRHLKLLKMERDADYPEVAMLYKVIADDSFLVLTDEGLVAEILHGKSMDPKVINRCSVRIWRNKLGKTCAHEIEGLPGLYALAKDQYDKFFLGYMKGQLPLLEMDSTGYASL